MEDTPLSDDQRDHLEKRELKHSQERLNTPSSQKNPVGPRKWKVNPFTRPQTQCSTQIAGPRLANLREWAKKNGKKEPGFKAVEKKKEEEKK
jgi:hypothetical protein